MAAPVARLLAAPNWYRFSAAAGALRRPWRTATRHGRGMASREHPGNPVLEAVGVFDTPKPEEHYDAGQLFLHKVFGYRGVVLFPWVAILYDQDAAGVKGGSAENRGAREVQGKTKKYYQVLVDNRDSPHIKAQTEAVTFLASQDDSRILYAIPGLDYASHEDLLPYRSSQAVPIQHQLFSRFFTYSQAEEPPFEVLETLWAWQDKNHQWLELSDVYRETTENLRVTVIPFYMGMRETHNTPVYWWRYCVRLENMGFLTIRLRERYWRIFSLSGTLETVRGRGVMGREPVLSKEEPAFQYSSHVSLHAPSGHMWGTFRMEREDGYLFDCRIPPFALESRPDDVPGYGT